jgi:predicted RNA-binding protein with PUA-like domain
MRTWILKTEPGTYSWDDLARDEKARWDGVRNFAAARNMTEMKRGDVAVIYHSGTDKAAVGLAKVVKEAYRDPTAEDPRWVAVDIAPVRAFKSPVTLAAMKRDKVLGKAVIVRQGRLSVSPLTEGEAERLLTLAKGA